jgi:putative transposase
MALDRSALLEVLEALNVAGVGDRVRQAAETIYQALIEAELTAVIGAAPHERSVERGRPAQGHRTRTLSTTAGDLELCIPKLRTGSFFPSLLERRRRVARGHSPVARNSPVAGRPGLWPLRRR